MQSSKPLSCTAYNNSIIWLANAKRNEMHREEYCLETFQSGSKLWFQDKLEIPEGERIRILKDCLRLTQSKACWALNFH